MKTAQNITDKLAIGLSLICAIHCLGLPLLLVWVPSITALNLSGETFHLWMVVAVMPTSIYALIAGCKQHRHMQILLLGFFGLAILISALLLESYIGEAGEKILTL